MLKFHELLVHIVLNIAKNISSTFACIRLRLKGILRSAIPTGNTKIG